MHTCLKCICARNFSHFNTEKSSSLKRRIKPIAFPFTFYRKPTVGEENSIFFRRESWENGPAARVAAERGRILESSPQDNLMFILFKPIAVGENSRRNIVSSIRVIRPGIYPENHPARRTTPAGSLHRIFALGNAFISCQPVVCHYRDAGLPENSISSCLLANEALYRGNTGCLRYRCRGEF